MKKIVSAFILLFMLLLLISCGNKTNSQIFENNNPTKSQDSLSISEEDNMDSFNEELKSNESNVSSSVYTLEEAKASGHDYFIKRADDYYLLPVFRTTDFDSIVSPTNRLLIRDIDDIPNDEVFTLNRENDTLITFINPQSGRIFTIPFSKEFTYTTQHYISGSTLWLSSGSTQPMKDKPFNNMENALTSIKIYPLEEISSLAFSEFFYENQDSYIKRPRDDYKEDASSSYMLIGNAGETYDLGYYSGTDYLTETLYMNTQAVKNIEIETDPEYNSIGERMDYSHPPVIKTKDGYFEMDLSELPSGIAVGFFIKSYQVSSQDSTGKYRADVEEYAYVQIEN